FGLPIKSDSTWERNVDDIAILSALTGPYAFDYVTGKFDFEKQKPILEYFSKMYKDGILMPGSESLDIEMIRANFVAGKIGMYMDGNWMINGFNNEVEGGKDANWDTMLVPVAEGTERAKDYLMLDSAIAMSQGCEEKEAAFEAIQYYLHNYYTAPTEKNPEIILPSSSLIIEDNEKVNSKPEVQALKGMSGIIDEENLAAFPVTPHTVLTLEGDSRDKVYPTLIIDGDSAEMDTELKKLSETYNNALQKALDEGLLKEEDIKPAGFDYYTR
ncbi:MAG TPA: extracellular solute-binding protein, partial [Candidatus Dorea intestinavium]|nr:extracellular solute-binding protein [Candidatus Dorea intestinavium]